MTLHTITKKSEATKIQEKAAFEQREIIAYFLSL